MTVIVGIMGAAGSGKSTAATYLVERYGAKRYALATPLKEILKRAFLFTDEQLYGSQADKEAIDPRYGFSPRQAMQRVGTEGIRSVFGEDVWVEMLLKQIAKEAPALAVIDDVRFVNEATYIRRFRSCGDPSCIVNGHATGLVWRLENLARVSSTDASHQSEAEWTKAPYDHIIAPIGDLSALYALLDDTCKHYTIFPKRPELPL